MPSFGDIMDVVDLLQIKAVEVDKDKCVRAANRNSKCDKCANACIASAINLSRGDIDIDYSQCVNCGCCVPVCPMDALTMAEPSAQTVQNRARKVADTAARSTMFACSRIASKNVGDPDRFAEVPCLGHISEIQIMDLVSSGLDDIILIDGNCETCKMGAASARIDATVETVERLLDACESEAIVTRQSGFPEEYLVSASNARGEGRRGLLRQTTSYVKTVAGNVAKKTIEEKLQEPGSGNGNVLAERLKRGRGAGILHLEPESNYRLIESMEKLLDGESVVAGDAATDGEHGSENDPDALRRKLSIRHFGNVHVDVERCSGCGMCVLFCPTEALKYDDFEEPANEEARYCDFQAADCTQCMLCKDVCLRECLEVSPEVTLGEVLDFEPRLLEIARPQKTTSLAGLARRNS